MKTQHTRNGARICRTVILDTQNIRGAPLHLLARVRQRGFALHLSSISLEEIWAQAVREGSPGLLGRLRTLAAYLDQHEPIKTAGVGLVQRHGGQVRGPLIPIAEDETPKLKELWRLLASERPPEVLVLAGASLIETDARKRADSWLAISKTAARIDVRGYSEQEVQRRVAHNFFETFAGYVSIRHGCQERFHAYFSAAALHAAQAHARVAGKRRKLDENDGEDLQLLMHIAEGAFIATYDLALIEHVDATGSFQAPWVRTLGELLTVDLPAGMPWGRAARRAVKIHQVRNRSEMNRLEESVRRTGSPTP